MPCHKHILAAVSPAFAAMVKNKHREAIEGRSNIEFSKEAGRALVQFIYTGRVALFVGSWDPGPKEMKGERGNGRTWRERESERERE